VLKKYQLKEWNSFELTLKIVNKNGKVLVDGCAIINVPEITVLKDNTAHYKGHKTTFFIQP
jgi:hypothetical protein